MPNILIFCAGDLSNYPQFEQCKLTSNLEEFLITPADKKYAFLSCWNGENVKKYSQVIEELSAQCEHVVLYASEFYAANINVLRKYDLVNVTIFCPKLHVDFIQADVRPWHFWLGDTARLYRTVVPQWLDHLDPFTTKSKYFDVLLGHERSHRTVLYNSLKEFDQTQMYVSYQQSGTSVSSSDSSVWLCLDPRLKEFCQNAYDSSHGILTDTGKFNLSQFIDVGIYNTSAYTVISETNIDNSLTWFTEKTAKPILAKRLFLVLSNQYFLRDLRELGFKTFDGIIDESYDAEPDVNQRITKIVEQMKFLVSQDQQTIFEKIRPIVDHNKKVIDSISYCGDLTAFAECYQGFSPVI